MGCLAAGKGRGVIMMPVQYIAPKGTHKRWTLRFTNWDGKRGVSVYAHDEREASVRLGGVIKRLVACKHCGDVPNVDDRHYIESMPPRLSKRLTSIGLLDRRRHMAGRPIQEHVNAFERYVAARQTNTAAHSKRQAGYVRRVCAALHIHMYDDLRESDILQHVKDLGLSNTTRRQYLIAIRDFCAWMQRDKRGIGNPLENTKLPDANDDTPRRPLTVDEFRQLMAYLETFERYPKQKTGWLASDRRLIYWFCVSTGLRQNETRTRRVCDLSLDHEPASVGISWRDAKNDRSAVVPFGRDLADALREYTRGKHPSAKLFPLPVSRNDITRMFERDLRGAGVEPRHPDTGLVIDFHALRTTAICWWLDVYGLSVKKTAAMARASERTVERYAKGYRLHDYSWLDKAPSLEVGGCGATRAG